MPGAQFRPLQPPRHPPRRHCTVCTWAGIAAAFKVEGAAIGAAAAGRVAALMSPAAMTHWNNSFMSDLHSRIELAQLNALLRQECCGRDIVPSYKHANS